MRHDLDLASKLNATRDRFMNRISDFCPVVEAFADTLSHGPVQTALMADIRMQAHKIAGSGRIFGFAGLSGLAAILEDELERTLSANNQIADFTVLISAARDFSAAARLIFASSVASANGDESADWCAGYEEDAAQHGSETAPSRPAHILIVDDDDLIREALVQGLSRVGWSFSQAKDGFEAISTLFRAGQGSTDTRPDLILMDVDMPHMDGFETLGLMRSSPQWSTTPVIMLTRRSDEVNLIRGIARGAQEYMAKPFDIGTLAEKITAMLSANASQIVVALGNNDTRQVLMEGLQNLPVKIVFAKSAKQAVGALRENTTRLVLIDDAFPDCNGITVADMMRADDEIRHKPIVSLHSADGRDAMFESLRAGHQDSLTAPFDTEEVIARLEAVLKRHG